jgi:hypothetical protein
MWPATWTDGSDTPLHVLHCCVSLRAPKTVMSHEAMVGRRMVLCEAVSSVELARSPAQVELSLCNAIFEPATPHVKRLGTFHLDLCFENIMDG